MKIHFSVEYDTDSHDWAVSGLDKAVQLAPLSTNLPSLLPFILATMLRDSVAPKSGAVHVGQIKIQKIG